MDTFRTSGQGTNQCDAADLLYIPPCLRRLAVDDPPHQSRLKVTVPRMPRQKAPLIRSKGARRPTIGEGTRLILFSLGWPPRVISRLSVKEANRIADHGVMMTPAAEINALKGTSK